MKNMNKLFLMSALLLAASSTSYAVMNLQLDNDRAEALTAHFAQPLADGRMHEAVNANSQETVEVSSKWLNNEVVVTWKNAAGEVKDTDTVHFDNANETLKSSSDDDQGDGHADKLR